ncbi:MAG TPA: ATP-binding protein [Chitinophagaceae bacterium]|nr:ATP-binding protein [Chitinophagaceae bacterium]
MKRIVIIGPESTGKSTLCGQLAAHYNTTWCPEYAREYLLTNGVDYSYDDLLTIAKGQIELEEKYAHLTPHTSHLFIDTDMNVMKVWCEFVFQQCHRWILDQVAQRPYDLYLLCDIDLPWQADALREYPDLESRQKLYCMYKDILVNQPVPWKEISGTGEERFKSAVKVIDNWILDIR